MSEFCIPADILAIARGEHPGAVNCLQYTATKETINNKVVLHQHLFSFLLEGRKIVYYPRNHAQIDNDHFLLLSPGNSIMTERLLNTDGVYRSLLLFFDNQVLTDFFAKHPYILQSSTKDVAVQQPFLVLDKDEFIRNYITSLCLLLNNTGGISQQMALLKVEELLMYVGNRYPSLLKAYRALTPADDEELKIKKVTEANIENNISVEELAFLCNISVSTFKRRFVKIYGTSPNRWMLQKRMERAADLLQYHGEKPAEVYFKVGYENLSSFSQSFKQVFGISPREFQQQKLNVHP
ncbi:MAG: AraC family transcriptional regulator [Chitinophagaceae bacterium]